MKFDVDRAITRTEEFAFPRCAGCAGEKRAADLLAELFARSGWKVERAETRAGFRTSSVILFFLISAACLGFWLWRALRLSFPNGSLAARSLAMLGGFLVLAAILALAVGRLGAGIFRERHVRRGAERRGRKLNVIACWTEPNVTRARILFVTHLDEPPKGSWEDLAWAAILLVILLLTHWGRPAVAATWGDVAIWSGVIIWSARRWLRAGRHGPGDNRTGLALLAELAETIPPRLHAKLEIQLAAVAGSATGHVGAFTLADSIRRSSAVKPTLVVNIESPGLGLKLLLVGRPPPVELARAAATDLWIPHRVARWPYRALGHRPFQLCRIAGISLAGDRRGSRIEPPGLSAVAQLATEIALRWARQVEQRPQEESAPKSSQKPG